MTTPDDEELIELRFHYGEAYTIVHGTAQWAALRRDIQGGWIVAPTADALFELIRADYARKPVPRDIGGEEGCCQ